MIMRIDTENGSMRFSGLIITYKLH